MAYLVAAYPAISHTFIAREVRALRGRGVGVSTMSIRKAPAEQLLTPADRLEAQETYSLLPLDRRRFAGVHLAACLAHPVAYARTLAWALAQSAGGLRAGLWQLFYFAEAVLVWNECQIRGIRHIHAHFANVASAVAMLASRFGAGGGLTWSFTMHGPTEFDDVTRYAVPQKVASASFVVCISDYCRSQLLRMLAPAHWEKLHVVHCGLEIPDGPDPASSERSAQPPVEILCVGRLVSDKGQLILLQAVAQLRAAGVAVRTTIVGEGPDRGMLERASDELGLTDCVVFAGALGHDRVAALYESSDIFCLPSFAEGVPVVLMEAMESGLPVVTTRIAGVAELVDDGVSGVLVDPGRADVLARELQRVAGDPELRRRWGQAGRQRVRRDYDVASSAEKLEKLFSECW